MSMEPYRNSLVLTSKAAAYDDILDDVIKPGFMRRYDLITCENVGHAYTELRIGIKRASYIDWLEGEKSPSAATLYWMDDPVILVEGEQLIVRFTGCTSGDELKVTIVGITKCIAPVITRIPETVTVPATASPEATPPLPPIAQEIEKITPLPKAEGKVPRKRYIWEMRKTIEEQEVSPSA